jgi:hypothetical protein
MADAQILTKRVAIDKTNAQMVIIVAVASFVTVFCLVASHAVWSQNSYQERVISADSIAHNQLQQNITAYNQLTSSYEKFVSNSTNVIGGSTNGNGTNSGNNAKIVLDALPPSYDFPALASTIASLLNSRGYNIGGIGGTDEQLAEQTNNSSPTPTPVEMPFTFSVDSTSYTAIGQLISLLQSSVRPIQIDSLELSGGGSSMTATITAHTYYQPSKTLDITKQVVK